MADVVFPQQPFMPTSGLVGQDPKDPNTPRSSPLNGPPPNPPFVFPMQSSYDAQSSVKETDPPSNGMPSSRAKTRSRPQQLSFNALPDFSFHPSSSNNKTPDSGTPSSPSKSQMGPSHHGGHRRNGSEFIGGDGRNATLGLMSSSPTKGEGVLPPPPGARTGPPSNRRGHAHRRSGAISSHDVSNILRPANEVRGNSAPTTPSDPLVQPPLPPVLDRSISQPSTTFSSEETSPSSHHRQLSSITGQARPRVGFSDHIEFIPRPLSTISSETSSSLSTIRPGHSVTGSISSIISAGNASPPSAKSTKSLAKHNIDEEVTSASGHSPTPDHVLHSSEQSRMAHSLLTDASEVPTEEPENAEELPSWSGAFLAQPNEQELGLVDPNDEVTSILRLSGNSDTFRSRRRPTSSTNSPTVRPRTSPEPKVSKRQKKVKSWADSLLARKMRHSLHEDVVDGRRSLMQQTSLDASANHSLENLGLEDGTDCVIDTTPRITRVSLLKSKSSPPSASERNHAWDVDSPDVLDLDAEFGSTSLVPSFEEVTGNQNASMRRRLHSSGATGSFEGPGMHYHRRAESAPELAPINRHIFGPAKLGKNLAMEDVFEEDEEEDGPNPCKASNFQELGTTSNRKDKQLHGLGVDITNVEHNTENFLGKKQHSVATLTSKEDIRDAKGSIPVSPAITPDESRAIDIVDADEEPRESVGYKSNNEPMIRSASAGDPFIVRPVSAPMQYIFPASSPVFATPEIYSSAVSTPNFSQSSFEGPRLHTASSSITDRGTLSSFRTGDQAFDLRVSVDDVPSLTSSASTMTNAYPPRVSSSVHTRCSADQPPPLSVALAPRTRPENALKRSSLASLSRLVGASYGEKSKLNIEERAQPEDSEKSEKKRGKRISRLMRFWKGKDKAGLS
ncbi:MAG: hypothetical protein Q9219_000779 [cf. Caloplaca sp. 3 TL-2023]